MRLGSFASAPAATNTERKFSSQPNSTISNRNNIVTQYQTDIGNCSMRLALVTRILIEPVNNRHIFRPCRVFGWVVCNRFWIRKGELILMNQIFQNALNANECIYKANYAGWYCVSDETFLTESQLKENDKNEKVSAESWHPVHWVEETNYIFRLAKFQDDILYWIKQGFVLPPAAVICKMLQ